MNEDAEVRRQADSDPSRLSQLALVIGDKVRGALGVLSMQPDHYLYPADVRDKASDILGLTDTLGHISAVTMSSRTDLVSGYDPRLVTKLIRDSERLHWTKSPGLYATLAKRVVREEGEIEFVPLPPLPRREHIAPTPPRPRAKRRRRRPDLRIVRDDE